MRKLVMAVLRGTFVVFIVHGHAQAAVVQDAVTLSVLKSGSGTGTVYVSPKKKKCGTTCQSSSFDYQRGSTVTLKVVPAATATFLGWGGACTTSGTSPSCTLTLAESADVSVSLGSPTLSTDAISLDFGSVGVIDPAVTRSITITNTGTGNLTVKSVKLSGNSSFVLSGGSVPQSILPGGSASLAVRFDPSKAAAVKSSLIVSSNDPQRPVLKLPITGTGVLPEGDPKNYFPLQVGSEWRYNGTVSANNSAPVSFVHAMSVTGTKVVSGENAMVVMSSNEYGEGDTVENLVVKSTAGIKSLATTLRPLVPIDLPAYYEVKFPLVFQKFKQFSKAGLPVGDLDDDGKQERASITSYVTTGGLEDITVGGETFTDCLRVVNEIAMTVKSSRYHRSLKAKISSTAWHAPGVGMVKTIVTEDIPAAGVMVSIVQELSGYRVGETARGILPSFTIIDGVAPAGSDRYDPGPTATASGATTFLVVSRKNGGWGNQTLVGALMTPTGKNLKTLDVEPASTLLSFPAAAYAGGTYLVVAVREGAVVGRTITEAGEVDDTDVIIAPAGSTSRSSVQVASDGTGYLVVWSGLDTNYRQEIMTAVVTADGTASEPVKIGEGGAPAVAYDGFNYFVTWSAVAGEATEIRGARVDRSGSVVDAGGFVIAGASGVKGASDVACDGSNCLVVWDDGTGVEPYHPFNIRGKRVAIDGTVLDGGAGASGIALATTDIAASNGRSTPSVAFDGTSYVVTWADVGYVAQWNPYPFGIYAVPVATDGNILAPNSFIIDTPSMDSTVQLSTPTAGTVPGGGAVVTWSVGRETYGMFKDIGGALIFPW